jgi:hypothetical protein
MAYLPGVIPSCHRDRRWSLLGAWKLPGYRYLIESMSSLQPVLQNITHGKSFLLGGAYPLAES